MYNINYFERYLPGVRIVYLELICMFSVIFRDFRFLLTKPKSLLSMVFLWAKLAVFSCGFE